MANIPPEVRSKMSLYSTTFSTTAKRFAKSVIATQNTVPLPVPKKAKVSYAKKLQLRQQLQQLQRMYIK